MAGAIGDLEGRACLETHSVGQRQATVGGEIARLRQTALPGEDRDTHAGWQVGDTFTRRFDDARHFHPEGEGWLGPLLVAAFRHQQIGEVQPAGDDSHPHLARTRRGQENLRHPRRLPDRCNLKRPHATPPVAWQKCTVAG